MGQKEDEGEQQRRMTEEERQSIYENLIASEEVDDVVPLRIVEYSLKNSIYLNVTESAEQRDVTLVFSHGWSTVCHLIKSVEESMTCTTNMKNAVRMLIEGLLPTEDRTVVPSKVRKVLRLLKTEIGPIQMVEEICKQQYLTEAIQNDTNERYLKVHRALYTTINCIMNTTVSSDNMASSSNMGDNISQHTTSDSGSTLNMAGSGSMDEQMIGQTNIDNPNEDTEKEDQYDERYTQELGWQQLVLMTGTKNNPVPVQIALDTMLSGHDYDESAYAAMNREGFVDNKYLSKHKIAQSAINYQDDDQTRAKRKTAMKDFGFKNPPVYLEGKGWTDVLEKDTKHSETEDDDDNDDDNNDDDNDDNNKGTDDNTVNMEKKTQKGQGIKRKTTEDSDAPAHGTRSHGTSSKNGGQDTTDESTRAALWFLNNLIDSAMLQVTPVIEQVTTMLQATPVIEQVTPVIEQVTPEVEQVVPTTKSVTPTDESAGRKKLIRKSD
jgi:hypothetical protein